VIEGMEAHGGLITRSVDDLKDRQLYPEAIYLTFGILTGRSRSKRRRRRNWIGGSRRTRRPCARRWRSGRKPEDKQFRVSSLEFRVEEFIAQRRRDAEWKEEFEHKGAKGANSCRGKGRHCSPWLALFPSVKLLLHAAGEEGLEEGFLVLAGDDGDFDLREAGLAQPLVEVVFGEPEPASA